MTTLQKINTMVSIGSFGMTTVNGRFKALFTSVEGQTIVEGQTFRTTIDRLFDYPTVKRAYERAIQSDALSENSRRKIREVKRPCKWCGVGLLPNEAEYHPQCKKIKEKMKNGK